MKVVPKHPIICKDCATEVMPTSYRQILCRDCARLRGMARCTARYERTKQLKGYDQAGEKNNAWKNGSGWYKTVVNEVKHCERCKSRKYLLVHHKDYDRSNNSRGNLEVLCRRCHQEDHGILDRRDALGRFTS